MRIIHGEKEEERLPQMSLQLSYQKLSKLKCVIAAEWVVPAVQTIYG